MTAQPALELDLVGRAVALLKNQELLPADRKIAPGDLPTVEQALRLGDSTPSKIPAVVIYLAADDATESVAPQVGTLQRVTATLAVVHIISAPNTQRGAGGPAVDPMAALVGRTRAVLNGWLPALDPSEDHLPRRERIKGTITHQDALALRRGRLLEIAKGRAWWQDEYLISWRARAVLN